MSAILAVPVPIEVMAMAGPGRGRLLTARGFDVQGPAVPGIDLVRGGQASHDRLAARPIHGPGTYRPHPAC